MNNLIPFDFNGNQVRVVLDENGDPWFVGKDVCEALGYADPTNAMKQHCKGVVKRHPLQTAGGMQEMRILAEPDTLRLIVNSQLPSAEAFERKVFEEILPSIRKTGSYSIRPKTALELAREQVILLERIEQVERERDQAISTKAEIGSRREATAMNTASQERKRANRLEAELDRSKQYCTVKRMEMLQHGQKFNWRLLKSTGIAMGIEPIDVFDANYGTVKSYHADVWKEAYAIDLDEASGGES
jgi:prophage antirepressor-like protein